MKIGSLSLSPSPDKTILLLLFTPIFKKVGLDVLICLSLTLHTPEYIRAKTLKALYPCSILPK